MAVKARTKSKAKSESTHDTDRVFEIVGECADSLTELGNAELAMQIITIAKISERDWLTTKEAAALAKVSHQTVKNWILRGIVLSNQAGTGAHHRIDKQSLLQTMQRRAQARDAQAAFSTGKASDAVAFISGFDKKQSTDSAASNQGIWA